jgi:hypothetical protein
MTTQGWLYQPEKNGGGTVSFVHGPIPPLLGTGSVKFDCPNLATIRLSTNRFTGQQLKFIHQMSFSTYVEHRTGSTDNLYLVIQVDTSGDGVPDFPLVFNPIFQSGKYVNHGHDQGPIVDRTWQSWDCVKGMWWRGPTPDPFDPVNPAKLYSLEEWVGMYPRATFAVANKATQGSLRFSAGAPTFGKDFIAYLDKFQISIKNETTIFDFEHCQQ